MRPANMTKLDTHIADLQTKLRQAESRKKDAIARQNAALKKKARQEDTRKKILVGSIVLKAFTRSNKPWPISELTSELDKELTRKDDRSLFSEWISIEKDNKDELNQ